MSNDRPVQADGLKSSSLSALQRVTDALVGSAPIPKDLSTAQFFLWLQRWVQLKAADENYPQARTPICESWAHGQPLPCRLVTIRSGW